MNEMEKKEILENWDKNPSIKELHVHFHVNENNNKPKSLLKKVLSEPVTLLKGISYTAAASIAIASTIKNICSSSDVKNIGNSNKVQRISGSSNINDAEVEEEKELIKTIESDYSIIVENYSIFSQNNEMSFKYCEENNNILISVNVDNNKIELDEILKEKNLDEIVLTIPEDDGIREVLKNFNNIKINNIILSYRNNDNIIKEFILFIKGDISNMLKIKIKRGKNE